MAELGLSDKPHCIWNVDESSFRMEHQPVVVFARRGTKTVVSRTSNNRESVTVLASVNAAGGHMPPMVIVRGKTRRSLDSWATGDAPTNTSWTYQEKGFMNDVLGTEWFHRVF